MSGVTTWEAGWLAIGGLPRLDLAALGALAKRWSSPKEALRRLGDDRTDLTGIVRPSARAQVVAAARDIDVSAVHGHLQDMGIAVWRTDGEPLAKRLGPEPGWPAVLSVRGDLLAGPAVAIVGMRKASQAGRRFAALLAAQLAEAGVSVVSGLAFGIDLAAHVGALEACGHTLAVLASGVGRPTPRSNADVADRILGHGGGLVSHVPPFATSPGWRFPIRNKLIAGLADAVVVVEAAERGGALSTAAHAIRIGVPLLAVPGPPLSPHSAGTNDLIADGALVCRGVDDVLCAAGVCRKASRAAVSDGVPNMPVLPPDDSSVLGVVGYTPDVLDAVARRSGLPLTRVLAALARLELAGLVFCPSPSTVQRLK